MSPAKIFTHLFACQSNQRCSTVDFRNRIAKFGEREGCGPRTLLLSPRLCAKSSFSSTQGRIVAKPVPDQARDDVGRQSTAWAV
jgi:hypothetical protein